jgi:hypothetical protein
MNLNLFFGGLSQLDVSLRLGAVPIGIWAAVAPAEPLAGPLPLVGQRRAASTLCTIPAEDLLMAAEDLFTMEVLFTVVVSFTWSTTMLCTMVEQRCKRPRCWGPQVQVIMA